MKANIVTRVIFDGDNNKVYLSVEGKVESATKEEKADLRDNLVRAFSQVLGIDGATASENEILKDFETTNNTEVPGFIEGANKTDHTKKVLEENKNKQDKSSGPNKQDNKTDENKEIEEPVIGFGQYAKMTAKQIIEKRGEDGVVYLTKFILPSLEKRLAKGEPLAKERIDSLKRAISNENGLDSEEKASSEDKSLIDKLNEEIIENSKAIGDPELMAIGELCTTYGTTYKEIIDTKNETLLTKIHTEFMHVVEEVKVKK